MLSQARVDRIKSTVDPVEVIRSRGIELKKNGKGYKGSCLVPSMTMRSYKHV